jgi:3-oxoacyl-[acyl-carrier protein] reductase
MKVLITGTSQGIGEAIARLFLSKGHKVIGFDRLPETKEQKKSSNFEYFNLDIGNKKDLPSLRRVRIIINNAGSLVESEALTGKLMGAYYVTEKYAFHKGIKSVLNISSNSAHFGIEFPMYVMANGALISYTKNLARRLAQYGATVNSISPGYVNTTLEKHLKDKKLDQEIYKHYLLGHIQEPKEIANLAYYMTVQNKSITGQDILMDCGESLSSKFVETPDTLKRFYSSERRIKND